VVEQFVNVRLAGELQYQMCIKTMDNQQKCTPLADASGANSLSTPYTISQLYGIPFNSPIQTAGNINAVIGALNQFYNEPLHQKFLREMGVRHDRNNKVRVRGPNAQGAGSTSTESSMDIQYITGLAPARGDARTEFWSINEYNGNGQGPFDAFFFIAGSEPYKTLPKVISFSLGNQEQPIDAYHIRTEFEFIKLALRGVTNIFSTGDNGVLYSPDAQTLQGEQGQAVCAQAIPQWPATSPYVLSVGATMLNNDIIPGCSNEGSTSPFIADNKFNCDGRYAKESVAQTVTKRSANPTSATTSGGGFSAIFPQPTYQKDAVKNFLDQTSAYPNSTRYPHYMVKSGRAYPDVAMLGDSLLSGRFTI
jgi:tripeptidyl-peptidase-1